MKNEILNHNQIVEEEMRKLREKFTALKKKREILQGKIDTIRTRNN